MINPKCPLREFLISNGWTVKPDRLPALVSFILRDSSSAALTQFVPIKREAFGKAWTQTLCSAAGLPAAYQEIFVPD